MMIARASLRLVWRRRLETLALTAIVLLIVFLYGALSLASYNIQEHVYVQMRGELGDVAVSSVFDEEDLRAIAEEAGASSYAGYLIVYGKALVGDESRLAVVIGKSYFEEAVKVKRLDGQPPVGPSEAAFYTVLTGGEGLIPESLSIGSRVKVEAFTLSGERVELEFDVVGWYRGFAWIAGEPFAIVVDDSVVERLTGGKFYLAAFWTEDPDNSDLDAFADRILGAMESRGLEPLWFFVNKKEENPIVNLVESATNILLIPASLVLLLAALLPAAAGSVAVVRDSRNIAVLKTMGAGWRELFAYYTLPWLIRGALGSLLALAALVVFADDVYFQLFVRDSEIAEIMWESLGFRFDAYQLVKAAAYAALLVALGSLVPLLLAVKLDTVRILRSTELPVAATPLRISVPGPVVARAFIRDLAARWWKMLGLVLALSILWGMTAAMEMEAESLDVVRELYESRMPPDVYLAAASVAPAPSEPAWRALDRLLGGDDSVASYTIFHSEIAYRSLEYGGRTLWLEFIYLLSGDPGTAFPLSEGRYPSGGGEALISEALASYLGLGVGDLVRVATPRGSTEEFTVVGLSYSRLNNGFYIVVGSPDVMREEPGLREAIAHIALEEGVPEAYSEVLRKRVEAVPHLTVTFMATRGEVVEGIDLLGELLLIFYAGITTLASIAAGIALAGIVLVDASARSRELAVLSALGVAKRTVVVGYAAQMLAALALSAPLALIAGYIIARRTAELSALALGYLEPVVTVSSIANPLLLVALAITSTWMIAAIWLYYRRLDVVGQLRE